MMKPMVSDPDADRILPSIIEDPIAKKNVSSAKKEAEGKKGGVYKCR